MHITLCHAQDVIGEWITHDSSNNQPVALIKIANTEGKYYARIKGLLYPTTRQPFNPTKPVLAYNGEPLIGLHIINGATMENGVCKGIVLDPQTGKEYKAKLWVDESNHNILYLRGYWGFFYQTQVWKRYTPPVP